jgi:hypothetical protein
MRKFNLFIRDNSKDIIVGIVVVAALFVIGSKVKENNEAKSKLSSSILVPK